jgi:ferrous iron transport protein A
METRFKDLSPGDRAEIVGFTSEASGYRSRLLAMGLTRGTELTLRRIAPFGDPVEVTVRGTSLSLRKSEADVLKLRRIS